jgi:hypothetical protein
VNTTPRWRKSSHSSGIGESDCVELADLAPAVGVRDSKDPDGPKLTFTRTEFAGFVAKIKASRLG